MAFPYHIHFLKSFNCRISPKILIKTKEVFTGKKHIKYYMVYPIIPVIMNQGENSAKVEKLWYCEFYIADLMQSDI